MAIILHISVRELERQLLSQPAVDNDAGHLELLASRRGQLFVFRFSLASIYNISISASHDNCTRGRLRNCLANLPQNNLSAHCRCRRGQNGTAAIERRDSGLQNATFHCLFGPGLQLGLDLVAGCNLISDRLSLIMSAVAKRIARYTLY